YYEFQFSEGDTDKAELIAPSAECYTAKPGESIYDISAKFGVSVEKLLKLNGWITNPLRLGEGTVILR
ncbi:MAG: LysM peptidoglycan-binding domain-containing protein, partial [Acutalibacteraceae bacterium]